MADTHKGNIKFNTKIIKKIMDEIYSDCDSICINTKDIESHANNLCKCLDEINDKLKGN